MPKLLVRNPEQGNLTFTLDGERITIGRHADNQIQIRHRTISGYHAELISRNGHFLLRDLGSTNHSYIEGIMFIEAELDRACRLVLGTVECDYLPDNEEVLPDEMDSLRKTIGLLRRQNDDLICKIAEQKNQIDILGSVKIFARGAESDMGNLRNRVKELTLSRDSLQEENRALCEELHELRALTGRSASVQVTRMAAGGDSGASVVQSRFAVPVGKTVMVPSPLAVMPAPALESPFHEIAILTGKLRARAAMLALHPADRNAFEDIISLTKEMCGIAAILGQHPVVAITASLDALLHDAAHHPPPIGQSIMQTAMQALDFLSRLLTHDVLARTEKLPPSIVTVVDGDRDLLPVIIASLESANLAAIGCADAGTALDTLRDNHCDLILLDNGLPDLCTRIRALPKHNQTPIILFTGDDAASNRERGAIKGASDFIAKPLNLFELTLKAHTWALKNRLDLA